jgi:hypothetical protein
MAASAPLAQGSPTIPVPLGDTGRLRVERLAPSGGAAVPHRDRVGRHVGAVTELALRERHRAVRNGDCTPYVAG